jgi:hypothetical protein
VHEEGTSAEVHLRHLGRGELQAAGDFHGQLLAQARHQTAHGRVAARPAVPALQRQVDGRAADALLEPLLHRGAVGLQAGDGGGGAPGGRQRLGDGLIAGQRAGRLQPALLGRHGAPVAGLAPAHDPRGRDVAVGVALAHAQQGLTVVVHLESPARHLLPSVQKHQG